MKILRQGFLQLLVVFSHIGYPSTVPDVLQELMEIVEAG